MFRKVIQRISVSKTKRTNGNRFLSSSTEQKPSSYVSGSTTHFGFADVPIEEKESKVKNVFQNVADSYDVMNDVMSVGIHRYWKDELLNMSGVKTISKVLRSVPDGKFHILDVAGGTGDVAFRFLEAAGCLERAKSSGNDNISITVCDINPDMLRVGERRARDRYGNAVLDNSQALKFKEGNAQDLDFDENSFDLYTIAFGLRNVTDVDMALREALRVLKPGGRYMCLEFSQVTNPALAAIYDTYSFNAIPALGELVVNDRASYQYLVESIRKFCNQNELKARLEAAGFEHCKYTNMTGGMVAVHEGWKPLE
jgi:ubiquinone/menaquinone biosynthesis methyltransferase